MKPPSRSCPLHVRAHSAARRDADRARVLKRLLVMAALVMVSVLVGGPCRRLRVADHVAAVVLPVVVAMRRVDQGSQFFPSLLPLDL